MTEQMKAKREGLKELSRMIQSAMKNGQYDSVNQGLVEIYNSEGHTEIHSFRKWKELGYTVRKGEKALLLWGEPIESKKQEKPAVSNGEEDFKFYPLAFVFSQKQVERIAVSEEAR